MKKLHLFGTTLMAVLLCVFFTACSKEDDNFYVIYVDGGTEGSIPKNVIRYQTTDGVIIRLENEDVFGGAKLIRNKYSTSNGYGVMTFDSDVTAIESGAFSGQCNLSNITLPNSVVTIGTSAFSGCSTLSSVVIPNSVTSIEDYAFDGCSNLKIVFNYSNLYMVPGSYDHGYVTFYADRVITSDESINGYYFEEKDGGYVLLCYIGEETDLSLPESYYGRRYSIGDYAFKNCSRLTSIMIPNSVTSIGKHAFSGCSSLTSVIIPNDVTSIEEYTFLGCSSLTSVKIPNSVMSIGDFAFTGCSSLTSVLIPNSVTRIGNSAFYCCI